MSLALVWFRRDLRLADNAALCAALAHHTQVLPVFVWAPEEEARWAPGAASRVWLHHSLTALDRALRARGSALILRRGPSLNSLLALARESGARAVYWNRLYEPAVVARDTALKSALRAAGLAAESHPGHALAEPWELKTSAGTPYRVFTPFWRALDAHWRARFAAGRAPRPAPRAIPSPNRSPESLPLPALELLPRVRWDRAPIAHWQPGETGAQARLREFLDRALAHYRRERDFPAVPATSRLSPHLHFGEISPWTVVWQVQTAQVADPRLDSAEAEGFVRQLGWRDFAHHLLYHFPHTQDEPLDPAFADFPWARPADYTAELAAWQRGSTGIPIVDAGLRELWATGYLHNRVRMIVASFLTKHLLVPWQEGARWFWDTLFDADLANNTLGWQWVAGCGADAAPYFRIFNPVLQSKKFDPEARYLKRWLPELQALNGEALHAPWLAPSPPGAYPPPICDLAARRERALAAYARIKTQPRSGGSARRRSDRRAE
ncbi:MAG: deoxyribodipyrimidine photo-lyase [Nevskia sp.]|nr:deoxyribodipyrimidine photo-lyase [Nevskia sp.]